MDYLVTCDGTPIGTVSIPVLSGLPYAELQANYAYESVRDDATAATLRFARMNYGRYTGDFAEAFARTWTGGRLGLTDLNGDEIAVASVMILANRSPRVIVDARPDTARSGAALGPVDRVDGARTRPAA